MLQSFLSLIYVWVIHVFTITKINDEVSEKEGFKKVDENILMPRWAQSPVSPEGSQQSLVNVCLSTQNFQYAEEPLQHLEVFRG